MMGNRVRTSAALGALVSLLGCDQAPAEAAPHEPAAVAERQAAIDPQLKAKPRRGSVIGGERVDRKIEWPDQPPQTRLLERWSADARAAVQASPLPVLLPPELIDDGALHTGESWFAFSGRSGEMTVTVQGSARAFVYPHIRAAHPTHDVRGRGGYLTRNEGIWVVSWIEHGGAYSLELECAQPYEGACKDESTVMDLVDGLVYVGGREAVQ